MSKFIQLEYSFDGGTDMVIINTEKVSAAHPATRRIWMDLDESYNLTERGWSVFNQAIQEVMVV